MLTKERKKQLDTDLWIIAGVSLLVLVIYTVFGREIDNIAVDTEIPIVLRVLFMGGIFQFVIDRRHMEYGAYGGTPDRLPEKFRLADTIGRKPRCEVGVFIFGQPGFHNAAAVGCVVFLSHGL